MTLNTRWIPAHDHEGEWSVHCTECLEDYLGRRAAEIREGEEHEDGRPFTRTQALRAAAAELAAEYDLPHDALDAVVDDMLHP